VEGARERKRHWVEILKPELNYEAPQKLALVSCPTCGRSRTVTRDRLRQLAHSPGAECKSCASIRRTRKLCHARPRQASGQFAPASKVQEAPNSQAAANEREALNGCPKPL
jgi:uncharacterized Zn finger protein